jgi:hypothetical protein
MSMQKNQFARISFWELLERYQVEIPIIQRDYAQGREGRDKLRKLFLNTLHRAVSGEPQELDFIYGDIRNDTFFPLDGQQRLTTLFLLYCYAAKKQGINCPESLSRLQKFTYETRVSSREFCKGLVTEQVEIDWSAKTISPFVQDCPWFFVSWNKDPSISGMLTMLDDIHRQFADQKELWEILTAAGSSPINFNFIPLNDFGLSDDLYIKMNARGRPLTQFENFKARLEKKIEDEKWDEHRVADERFCIKADTRWTDFFWSSTENFDEAFLNLINHVLVCSIAGRSGKVDGKKHDLALLLEDSSEMTPDYFDRNDYAILYETLEVYAHVTMDSKDLEMPFWGQFDKASSLVADVIANHGQQYNKRILLLAQTLFFQSNSKDMNLFSDWMRVVRNIIQNARTDGTDEFIGAVTLINELMAGLPNIYDFLKNDLIKSKFAAEQVAEEVRKAKLIAEQPAIKSILHRLEDNHFCQGRISFALYCVTENELNGSVDSDVLLGVLKVFEANFSDGINDLIRRALLTIGDGNYFKYWDSWLFAVESRKYCLIKDDREFRQMANNKEYRFYLKKLVLALNENTLSAVIETFTPDQDTPCWRTRVIKEPDLLSRAEQKFLALNDSQSICYLIPRQRVANTEEGRDRLIKISDPEILQKPEVE